MDGNERQKTLSNAGKYWPASEDKDLCSGYDSGDSIANLAIKHGRTKGAITFRLEKLGKIQPSSQVPPKPVVQKKHSEQSLDTKLTPNSTINCIDCGRKIFIDPKKATVSVRLCKACYKRRMNPLNKNIQVKQKVITRRIDEGIAGTREDNKKMRTWKLS